MRRETVMLMLVVGAVALAGCTSNGGGKGGDKAQECEEHFLYLSITQGMGANIPLYQLNKLDENGNPQYQHVVAMGFQADASGLPNAEDGGLEVPNFKIEVQECDTVNLEITNLNDLEHTLHLHGGLVDWTMDGVPFLNQMPIHSGDSFVYRFEDMKAGTYWFHCHVDPAHHIDLGMYGAFIVHERKPPIPADGEFVLMLDEWDNCHIHEGLGTGDLQRESRNYPAGDAECFGRKLQDYYAMGAGIGPMNPAIRQLCDDPNVPQAIKDELPCDHDDPPANREPRTWWYVDHPPYTPEYNTFTINGKAFPDTTPMYFEEGKTYRMRLINVGNEWHSMHIHGHKMLVAYRDGYELPNKFYVDTLSLGPGERYDVIIEADNPGFWMFHDHNGLAGTNDNQDPGGMMTVIAYTGDFAKSVGFDPSSIERAIDVVDFTKQYHESGHAGHGANVKMQSSTLKPSRDAMGILTYS